MRTVFVGVVAAGLILLTVISIILLIRIIIHKIIKYFIKRLKL